MRKIATLATAVILAGCAGGALAAPVTYVPGNSGNIGYSYNSAKKGVHQVYLEYAPISKLVVGAEYRRWINTGSETDIYAKYRIGHAYIGIGNRNYYDSDAKVFGLVEGMTNLTDHLDGYASLKFSGAGQEWKVGVLYDVMPRLDLDLNYTYYNRKHNTNQNGVGVGLNYRF